MLILISTIILHMVLDLIEKESFAFGNGFGKNIIILGADMSSSVHADYRTKSGNFFVQGLDNIAIYAEKLYSINFTKTNTKFCLNLHYNGANNYLFVNGIEIHKFKAKDSEIVITALCLGNISKRLFSR